MRTLAVLLSFLGAVMAVSSTPLRIATTDQLAPFGPLVVTVVRQAGFEAVIQTMPQARMVVELQSGIWDGAFFFTDLALEQMPGMVKVPVSLYRNEIVAVAARPGVRVSSRADLSRYSVGIERGNKTHEAVVKGLENVQAAEDQATQFRMLAVGRFDVAISSRALLGALARQAGIPKLYIQEPPLSVLPLYLAVTRANQAAVPALASAFARAVESGQWAKDLNAVLAKANQ